MPKRAMTITEFTEAYGVGETFARKLIKEGRLLATKVSPRKFLIRVEDAEAFLNGGKIAA